MIENSLTQNPHLQLTKNCPLSSVERAIGFYPTGREFESLRGCVENYENMIQEHYSKIVKSGDTVLDIGANIGRHTVPLCELVGENGWVVAFEPVPETREQLILNTSDYDNIFISSYAVSDFNGYTSFIKAIHSSGTMEESGIKQRDFNDKENTVVEEIDVKVLTIDSLDTLDNISFIKIDIEGGEIKALKGAMECISLYRPYIATEYGYKSYLAYGDDEMTLWKFCSEVNYTIFDIYLNKISDVEKWKNTVNQGTWDYLLVPNEKVDSFINRMIK